MTLFTILDKSRNSNHYWQSESDTGQHLMFVHLPFPDWWPPRIQTEPPGQTYPSWKSVSKHLLQYQHMYLQHVLLLAGTGAGVKDGRCRTKTREQDVRRQHRPRVSPRECSGRCLRLSWRLAFFIKPTFLYIYLTGRWSRQGQHKNCGFQGNDRDSWYIHMSCLNNRYWEICNFRSTP